MASNMTKRIPPTLIIRDKQGFPMFDEWQDAPDIVQERYEIAPQMVAGGPLTESDWQYINQKRAEVDHDNA